MPPCTAVISKDSNLDIRRPVNVHDGCCTCSRSLQTVDSWGALDPGYLFYIYEVSIPYSTLVPAPEPFSRLIFIVVRVVVRVRSVLQII